MLLWRCFSFVCCMQSLCNLVSDPHLHGMQKHGMLRMQKCADFKLAPVEWLESFAVSGSLYSR